MNARLSEWVFFLLKCLNFLKGFRIRDLLKFWDLNIISLKNKMINVSFYTNKLYFRLIKSGGGLFKRPFISDFGKADTIYFEQIRPTHNSQPHDCSL